MWSDSQGVPTDGQCTIPTETLLKHTAIMTRFLQHFFKGKAKIRSNASMRHIGCSSQVCGKSEISQRRLGSQGWDEMLMQPLPDPQ